jgi:hypothetical protein
MATPKRNVDITLDFGTTPPPGLGHADGLCNYQYAATGPGGYVVFYCTKEIPCSGDPHGVVLGDASFDHAHITWRCLEDIQRRREEAAALDGLSDLYSPADAATWLNSPHKQLGGASAIDLLGTDRAHEVFAIIDGLNSGAYA